MRQALILIFIFFSFSCDNSKKEKEATKNLLPQSTYLNTNHLSNDPFKIDYFSFVNKITDIDTLIMALNNNESLEGEAVGITGDKTLSYTYFKRLMEIAHDSTLLQLTCHANPKLRVYGMWALAANNKSLALSELKRFKNDTTPVTYHVGCIVLHLPVHYLVKAGFDSIDFASTLPQEKAFIFSKD